MYWRNNDRRGCYLATFLCFSTILSDGRTQWRRTHLTSIYSSTSESNTTLIIGAARCAFLQTTLPAKPRPSNLSFVSNTSPLILSSQTEKTLALEESVSRSLAFSMSKEKVIIDGHRGLKLKRLVSSCWSSEALQYSNQNGVCILDSMVCKWVVFWRCIVWKRSNIFVIRFLLLSHICCLRNIENVHCTLHSLPSNNLFDIFALAGCWSRLQSLRRRSCHREAWPLTQIISSELKPK